MASQIPTDVQQSISSYVAQGTYPSEADVLRAAIRLLDQRQEDLASIKRGMQDIADGATRPALESNDEFRQVHKIPSSE